MLVIPCLVSCTHNQAGKTDGADPYVERLTEKLPQKEVVQVTVSLPSTVYHLTMIAVANDERFVLAVHSDRYIRLLNSDGDILSRAGGRGRGPGEFEMISHLYVGNDRYLYAKDLSLKRVTVFEIENDELVKLNSHTYAEPDLYTLIDFYITDDGYYGLYHESEGFRTPENQNLLYSLNEEFEPVDRIKSFPGEKREAVEVAGFLSYPPHDYSNKYLWSQNDNSFYFVNTYSARVNRFDFSDRENSVLFDADLPVRPSNNYFMEAADNQYDFETNREYWSVLEGLEDLPVLSGIWANETQVLLSIRPAPGDDILMLHNKKSTGKLSYFHLPPNTGAYVLMGNQFYSVIPYQENGNYTLLMKTSLKK